MLGAARRAKEYVQTHCPDPALRGALTLRFADPPIVRAALADLPAALDESGVARALQEVLARGLPTLTLTQVEKAARLYTDALLRTVSTLKDFALPVIYQGETQYHLTADPPAVTLSFGLTRPCGFLTFSTSQKAPRA